MIFPVFFILQLKERNLRDQQMPKPANVSVIVLFFFLVTFVMLWWAVIKHARM